MQDEDIRKAEMRVMEMNRMTKQLAEQGNRYIQDNGVTYRRSAPPRTETETRFEPVPPQNVRQEAAPNTNSAANRNKGQNNSFQRNNAQNRNNGGGQVVQNRRSTPQRKPVPPPPIPEPVPEPPAPPPAKPTAQNSGGISELLPSLGLDSEQLLLIALMYLLIREKADLKLIAALGYILL